MAEVAPIREDRPKHRPQIFGAIIGHGALIPDRYVVIPRGIYLQPFSSLGNMAFMTPEVLKILASPDERRDNWEKLDELNPRLPESERSHIYKPGDIIYDMNINFKATWEGKCFGRNMTQYISSGIFTDQPTIDELKISSGSDEKIKEDSTKGHDTNVIPIGDMWGKRITLGAILKLLIKNYRHGKYYLVACRIPYAGHNIENVNCCTLYDAPVADNAMGPPKLQRSISKNPQLVNIGTKLGDIMEYVEYTTELNDVRRMPRAYSKDADVRDRARIYYANYRNMDKTAKTDWDKKWKIVMQRKILLINRKMLEDYTIDKKDLCFVYVVNKIITYIKGDSGETENGVLMCVLTHLLMLKSDDMEYIQLILHLLSHSKQIDVLISDIKSIHQPEMLMNGVGQKIQVLREKHNPSVSSLHGGGDWKHIYHKNKYHHNLLKIK
jgi:hypothetical protein